MNGERIRAFAELARVSNVPTVWSNVLVGTALAHAGLPWGRVGATAVAMSAFYAAGMALNDLVDRRLDAVDRPHRPIPSGRVSVAGARAFAIVCFTLGLSILLALDVSAALAGLGLLVAIVAYDLLHKRSPAAAMLMGACRGLVYVGAAFAAGAPRDATALVVYAAAIAAYTTIVTVLARDETEDRPRPAALAWLLVPPVGLPLVLGGDVSPFWPVVLGVAYVVWTRHGGRALATSPPRPMRAVLAWLAGIALADAFFLALLARPGLAVIAVLLFLLTGLGHARIRGT